MALHAHPTPENPDFSASAEMSAALASALEDAGPTIAAYEEVVGRLRRAEPGSRAFEADRSYARELLSQISSRAKRIELEDGQPLTGEGLIKFAHADRRARARLPANPSRATERSLREAHNQAMARRTDRLRELNAAKAAYADAIRDEEAAEQAYKAYGCTALVLA